MPGWWVSHVQHRSGRKHICKVHCFMYHTTRFLKQASIFTMGDLLPKTANINQENNALPGSPSLWQALKNRLKPFGGVVIAWISEYLYQSCEPGQWITAVEWFMAFYAASESQKWKMYRPDILEKMSHHSLWIPVGLIILVLKRRLYIKADHLLWTWETTLLFHSMDEEYWYF